MLVPPQLKCLAVNVEQIVLGQFHIVVAEQALLGFNDILCKDRQLVSGYSVFVQGILFNTSSINLYRFSSENTGSTSSSAPRSSSS